MVDKIVLAPISSFKNDTTATTTYNNNNTLITTAIDNTLSRDGTSPNQMNATLDMNSNSIINLPAPVSSSSPMRLADLNAFNAGTITPLTGVMSTAIIGSTSPSYATITINGVKSDPVLTHNAAAMFAMTGASNDLVIGIGSTNPQAGWIQVRSSFFDSNPGDLMLQPVNGNIRIGVTPGGSNFATMNNAVQIGPNWTNQAPYLNPGGAFVFAALSTFNTSSTPGGITILTRTSSLSSGSVQGLTSYGWADNNVSGGRGMWNWYAEGHKIAFNDYHYAGGEIASVNHVSGGVLDISPMNPIPGGAPGGSLIFQLESGNGLPSSDYLQYSTSACITLNSNWGTGQNTFATNKGFLHGIVFRDACLDINTYNPADAICMVGGNSVTNVPMAISWWNSGTNRAWILYSDASNTGLQHFIDLQDTNVIINNAGLVIGRPSGVQLAANATDGFIRFPSCAGAPTGTPSNIGYNGSLPMIFDTTNSKLWVWNGSAWKGVVLS